MWQVPVKQFSVLRKVSQAKTLSSRYGIVLKYWFSTQSSSPEPKRVGIYNLNSDKTTGKIVLSPDAPRQVPRSELYGFKMYLEEGPCDRISPAGHVTDKASSRWVNPLKDAQPQKFIHADGETQILGVPVAPIDEAYWDATRNTLWNMGTVNTPVRFRTRMPIFANYDFIMKSDYCMFWIPTFLVFSISVPTYCMTYMFDELAYTSMTVKVIGRQWYWVFEVESPTDDEDENEDEEENDEDDDDDET